MGSLHIDRFPILPAVLLLLVLIIPAPAFSKNERPVASPAPAPLVPFDQYSDDFIETHGLGEDGGPRTVDALLERGYVRVRLGIFDVWHPRHALRDSSTAKEFEAAADAILDLQRIWVDWTAAGKPDATVAKDHKALKKWIRSWKTFGRKKKQDGGRPDLLDLLEAKENVRKASRRFSDLMLRGGKSEYLVLSPTRLDFLGLGSFLGSLNDTNKRILWRNGLALWTSFTRDGVHYLALEHPATWPGRGDITRGIDMNSREKSGLLQHVVQHAAEILLARYYKDVLPGDLLKGLAMNMVIEMYKENNVRAGGGTKGRKTEAYSKFVAGGNAAGGRLAARNADNHWRHSKGRDYFLAELRAAQKRGAASALETRGKGRDKRAYFALEHDSGSGETHIVRAPFFVEPDDLDPIPNSHKDEYLEFRRAYRSAFVHWLKDRMKYSGRSNAPEILLGRLLQFPAPEDGGGRSFEERVEEIYGQPFTNKDGSSESLEWRFLDWLAGKR